MNIKSHSNENAKLKLIKPTHNSISRKTSKMTL